MTTNEELENENGTFFWLGADGATELSEDDFNDMIESVRKAQDDYLNAR